MEKETTNETTNEQEIVEEVNEKLEDVQEAQEEVKDDWQDKYIRLYADFDNFKKRTQKEMLSSYTNGAATTIEAWLPVIDNFERAVTSIEENDESTLAQGVKMIYKIMKDTMQSLNISEIPALGEKFDPNIHNAVMHVDDDNYGENEIIEEFMKGYKVKDKIIRHSMVKVAN